MAEVPEILNKVCGMLAETSDHLYYLWYGMIYEEQDVFTRLDKTFMILMYHDQELDEPVIRITNPFVHNVSREPHVFFLNSPLYKITDGNRRGKHVVYSQIREDDSVERADQTKSLIQKHSYECLQPDLTLDKWCLTCIRDFYNMDPPEIYATEELVIPNIYLCMKEDSRLDLFARADEETQEYLKSLNGYDSTMSMHENLQDNLLDSLKVSAGKGRIGLPFDYVYGRGVLAADSNRNGRWFRVPKEEAYKMTNSSVACMIDPHELDEETQAQLNIPETNES